MSKPVLGLLAAVSLVSCAGRSREEPVVQLRGVTAVVARTPGIAATFAHARPLTSTADGTRIHHGNALVSFAARLPPRARAPMRLSLDETRWPGVWLQLAADVPLDAFAREEGRALTFPAVAPSTDLVLFSDEDAVEELRVLYDRAAPTTFRWNVQLGPALARLRVLDGLIEALDHDGRARFRAAPMFAFDAAGTRRALEVRVEGSAIVATLDRTALVDPIVVDPAWGSTAGMSTKRFGATPITLASGKVLVAGGSGSGNYTITTTMTSTAETYDGTTLSWTAIPSMSIPRIGHGLTELPSGKILALGGSGLTGCLTSGEAFDPATSTWSAIAAPPKGRYTHAQVLLPTGKILIAAGYCAGYLSDASIYDPGTNTWSAPTNAMRNVRNPAVGAPLGTRGAIVAGDYAAHQDTEIYDIASNAFVGGPSFVLFRALPSLVTLKDGRILAVGGRYQSPTTGFAVGRTECEILSPTGGGWSLTGTMTEGRHNHTSTLLSDGRVLTAAGQVIGSTPSSTSEIFDPVTATWSSGGAFTQGRVNSQLAALPDKRAIIMGGSDGYSTHYNSVELFGDAVATGTKCGSGGSCSTGFCVDGVCCDRACTGACEACNETGSVGTCVVVSGASRPGHGTCGSTTGTCAGRCDGTAATCTIPGSTVACVSPTCVGGVEQPAAYCTGTGGCGTTPSTRTCAPYGCGTTSCKTTCATDADCATGNYCEASVCKPKGASGAACASNSGCTTGFCADGVCCNEVCDGACKSCKQSGSTGTCVSVDGVSDPHGKCAAGECADVCKAGACAFKPATADCGATACTGAALTAKGKCSGTDEKCNAPAPMACPDGLNCADATTCKTRCASAVDCVTGVCDAASGKCVGALPEPDAGVADAPKVDVGSKPTVAEFQRCTKNSECPSGFCVDGVCCDSACGDKCHSCALLTTPGKCTPEPVGVDLRNECGPSSQCLGTCGPDQQCIGSGSGTMCARNRCVGPSKGVGPAYCPGPGGKCALDEAIAFECAPYACEPAFGACLTSCKGTEDCANGSVCDIASKTCVPAPTPAAAEDGGCALSRSRSSLSAAVVMLLGLGLLRRRRR